MTAELIVLNKNGLALAADSAVSVAAGGQTTKVYNTSNKLFALSKYQPVGVMTYGSAEIMGLPWEVVIKLYRQSLGDRSYRSLGEYAESLFEYLRHEAITPECYMRYVKQRTVELFGFVMFEVDRRIEELIDENGAIEEAEIVSLHTEQIDETLEQIYKVQKDLGIEQDDIQESLSNHRVAVEELVDELLESRPVVDNSKRDLIDACLIYAIVFPSMSRSGLVVAGFGDADIFPHVKGFEIHKILDGKIHFDLIYEAAISLDNRAEIKAFAQTNETRNFMNGLSGRIGEFLRADAKNILSEAFAQAVMEKMVEDGIVVEGKQEDCRVRLRSAAEGVHAFLQNEIEKISFEEFSGPVVDAVAFFNPTEMAIMAETLVSLESFRQQVTLSSETVGGPIDVAVVTRGDGFIWMKRKHYFDPELNHQFFHNYNREARLQDVDKDHQ